MKKRPRDTLELAVDRSPKRAEIRRKAREAYLNELGLNATDDNAIDREIGKRIKRAKSIRDRGGNLIDPEKYELLSELMAVFLLASEPKSRRLRLQRTCIGEGVAARSNTRLLHLVVRAFGAYSTSDRREAHRDSMATEYAMLQGATPPTLVSYFSTPGQGLDATYRRALEYFQTSDRKAPTKISITMNPKAHKQLQSVPVGAPFIGYFINTTPVPTLKSCITNPSRITAMLDFANHGISRGMSSLKKTPVIAPKGPQRVIGKRPGWQLPASDVHGKVACPKVKITASPTGILISRCGLIGSPRAGRASTAARSG